MEIKTLFENVLKKDNPRELLIRFLKNDTMFVGLTRKEAVVLNELFHSRQYRRNEVVFNEGDVGSAMYIIYSGGVEVFYNKKSVIQLKRGDFFGEIALLDNYIRTASTVSIQDKTTLLVLSKSDLDDLINRNPGLANKIVMRISQVLAKRLKRMTEQKIDFPVDAETP